MPLNLDSLDDAEKFQKHFVSPMIDAVRAEIGPLVKRVEALESGQPPIVARVAALEGSAKKLMTVYSGAVGIVTFFVHYGWMKVKTKFFS